jgi:asparagine synthase (glutamine-hydrolysing)
MCGIAGIVNCPDDERLARMTDVQAHRGPEDEGLRSFPEKCVGLGLNRLSIIDLSPPGASAGENKNGKGQSQAQAQSN